MRGPRRRAAALVRPAIAAALAFACVSGASELERRFPQLEGRRRHRLADAHPYFAPVDGALTLFLCRWDARAPISVSLPTDATPEEQTVLEAALSAWEGAGLGVRFVRAEPREGELAPRAAIEIRFADADLPEHARSGGTRADCALTEQAFVPAAPDALPARLVRASVVLSRTNPDELGRPVALSRERLAGAALHELGHALGFQGHARSGPTVMVSELFTVERIGGRMLAGEPFDDPTLRALYALPSGAVVRRVPLDAASATLAERLAARARASGFAGPFARVGDRAGRLLWRGAAGGEYALDVVDLRAALRGRESWILLPNADARRLLRGDAR